tara:strand:- start:918 stop:2225 length:1308 start_codon:yes stop_codon:yes gene_type:complete
MSTQAFDRKFTKPLLKKLDAEARKAVTRQRGQLLILADTKELQQVIEAATGHRPKAAHLTKALKEAQKHAKKLQSNFKTRHKRRYNAVVAKLPEINLPYTLNKDMFIVSSFSRSITTIKNTMLKTLVAEGAISDAESKTVSKNLHKGHGARGNAVSQVQIASSVAGLDAATKKLLLYNIEGAFRAGNIDSISHREIKRLITDGEQIVTKKGKLTANYVSVIAFQSGSDNIKDSVEEKAVKAVFRNFIGELTPELLNMEGSSTLKEKALAAVTENFKGKKHLKVKSKSVQLRTKTKNKSSGAKVSSTVALTARRSKTRKKKEKAKASAASQPLAMVAMINKELPETVRKNMDSPGLVNRTGRFAESVRVTDVIQTPKGFPSFGYKYQMNPYQVFEDGGNGSAPWANGNRDPRGLIDRSIREIAKDLAIGRFYTRRV